LSGQAHDVLGVVVAVGVGGGIGGYAVLVDHIRGRSGCRGGSRRLRAGGGKGEGGVDGEGGLVLARIWATLSMHSNEFDLALLALMLKVRSG
jgi:hypothetical protein